MQLKESRILLSIGIRNPSSIDKESEMQCLKSGIHCMENVLDSLVHGTRKYNCLRSRLKMKKTGERRSKPTSDGTNGDRFPRHLRAPKGHALGCHEGMLPP